MSVPNQTSEGPFGIDPRLVSLLWADIERSGEIAELHAQLFDPPWDEAGVRGLLDNPGSSALIAKVRNTAEVSEAPQPPISAGFIIGQIAADQAEIISVGVLPEYQKHGLGRMLVEGLVRALQRAEVKRVFLDVAADNTAALSLYYKLRFEQVSSRAGYYKRRDNTSVDALVLSRAI